MRSLLLIFCLSLVACKTENKIEGKTVSPLQQTQNEVKKDLSQISSDSVLVLPKTPQLILPHAPHASLLRSKLLLQLINREFKTQELTKITSADEFKFTDKSEVRKQFNLDDFQKKSEMNARVIVSNTQNVSAYFVPANVPVKSLINELNIQEEENRSLVWMSPDEGATQAGQVIYLLSVNHEDLMEMDRMTYSEVFNVDSKATEQKLKLKYGQVAEVEFQFDYFVQMLQVQKFRGTAMKCSPDDKEAGLCEPCTFDREVSFAQFKPQAIASFNDLGFDVTLGGKRVELNDLTPKFANNNLSILINANSFSLAEDLDFQFLLKPKTFSVVTNGFNFGNRCAQRNFSNTEILQSKAQSNMKVKIYGRGTTLKKIKLN